MHGSRLHTSLAAVLAAALAAACGTDSESTGPDPDGSGGASGGSAAAEPLELSGCPRNYVVETTIGETQAFNLRIDTGSTTMAVAGTACGTCAAVSPLYEPGPDAIDHERTVDCTYAAGTGWTGDVYQDTVSLGPDHAVSMRFVAITEQDQFFFNFYGCGPQSQGLIGLGRAANAIDGTDSVLDLLVAEGMPDVFAVQLCPVGGKLWLGGYDAGYSPSPPAFVPHFASVMFSSHYSVRVTSVGVAGTTLPLPSSAYGAAVLDTGSSITIVSDEIFTAFTSQIYADETFVALFGEGFFDAGNNCASPTESKAELDEMLPTLTLTFDGPTPLVLESPATESYLLPIVDDQGGTEYCAGIRGYDLGISLLLGDAFMMSKVLVFDRQNAQVGFAQASCSG